jgi:hypothetical protein
LPLPRGGGSIQSNGSHPGPSGDWAVQATGGTKVRRRIGDARATSAAEPVANTFGCAPAGRDLRLQTTGLSARRFSSTGELRAPPWKSNASGRPRERRKVRCGLAATWSALRPDGKLPGLKASRRDRTSPLPLPPIPASQSGQHLISDGAAPGGDVVHRNVAADQDSVSAAP